jgi:sulfur relay (sulfurtransferase) DsrC/TusE family protein
VLAKSENITLTDAYWPIFDFMRVYYNEHGAAPDVRHTAKQMGEEIANDEVVVSDSDEVAFYPPVTGG